MNWPIEFLKPLCDQLMAAYGHRTFNAGFPAMNPNGRPSQPDPNLPVGILQSRQTLSLGFSHFTSTKQPFVTSGSRPSADGGDGLLAAGSLDLVDTTLKATAWRFLQGGRCKAGTHPNQWEKDLRPVRLDL